MKRRDGTELKGTVSGYTDAGLMITDVEAGQLLVRPEDLTSAQYLYVGYRSFTTESVEVMVNPNGKIEEFDGEKGFVSGSPGRYLFRKQALLGSLSNVDVASLAGRPVLYLARGVPQQLLRQVSILDASGLDTVLDEISQLAARGKADIARAFCKLLTNQFKDDEDINAFIRKIDETCYLDFYEPLPPSPPGYLTPRGRIVRSSGRNLSIVDVASHEELFGFEQQLMGELYEMDDKDLIGQPVCYTITQGEIGYQARTIIKPVSYGDAIQYARELKDKLNLPLNARDLVRMVAHESGMNQARQLFNQWNWGQKLWESLNLPAYTGEPRTRLIPRTNTAVLERTTDHMTVTEMPVDPESPRIAFGDPEPAPIAPGMEEVPIEVQMQEDVPRPEIQEVIPTPEPPMDKDIPQEIQDPDVPDEANLFSLESCPDGDTLVFSNDRAIYRYRTGTVYARRNGVTKQYTFNLEDLIDPDDRDLAARNQYTDRDYYDRKVLCLLDDENEKAFYICAPGTVRELLQAALDMLNEAMSMSRRPGDPESLALLNTALGYTEIVLQHFPGNSRATLFRSHIQSHIQELSQTCFKAPQGGLQATGIVSSIAANGAIKLTDAAYPRGIRLLPAEVVDRDYSKPRPGDELVYAVYVDVNGRVFPRFAHLARTPDELLAMADMWAMEGEVEKAWGIVMNILDALPEHEGALSRKAEYENANAEDGNPVVSLSCRTLRNTPVREDPFAAGHRERQRHRRQDAIRLFRMALSGLPENERVKKSACIRNIIEMYSELYRENPADTALLTDYRQFGTDNLLISGSSPTSFRLIGSTPENLDLIIRFYEDIDDAQHLAEAWLQKKALLQRPTPRNRLPENTFRVVMADVDANISWNYIRSGRLEEASQALQNALNRDSANELAVKCQAVIAARKQSTTDEKVLRNRLPALNLELLDFSDNPFLSPDIPVSPNLTMERFRLLLSLKETGSNHEVRMARYIASLLESPADYPLAVSKMAALPPDAQLVRQLYGCTRKGIAWQGWADIQLACILSVDAARSVCKYLFYLDPGFMRAWLLTFPFANEGGRNEQWSLSYTARMFQEWRKAQYEAYTQMIGAVREAGSSLADLADAFERISQIEQGPWIQKDDFYWASSCRRLSIRINNYQRARTAREIHNSFKDVTGLAEQMFQRIKAYPTVLSYLSGYRILTVLQEEIGRDFDARHFVTPTPVATLVSASNITADGRLLAVVAIETEENASSMLRCELSVVNTPEVHHDGYGSIRTYSDTSKVDGGEPLYYLVRFRLGQNADREGNATLSLSFTYDVDGMERQRVDLDVPVPVTHDFESIVNPYSDLGSKEENPDRFYGREKDLKEVVDTLSVPGKYPHFMVYGQKRSGKSSLLFHIQRQLDLTNRFLSAETDFLSYTVNREEDIYYHILIKFRKELQKTNRKIRMMPGAELLPLFDAPRREDTTFESFQDTFETVKEFMAESPYWKNHKIVLFIDEFTKAYEWFRQGRITNTFLQHWKSLSGMNLFCAVLIGQDTLSAFMEESRDRNAFGVSNSKHLNYLTKEGARKLATEPFIEVTGDPGVFVGGAVDRILYYSACSAYHTKWICRELIERMNLFGLKKITEVDVEEAVRDGIFRGDDTDVKKLIDPLTTAGLDQNYSGRFTAAQAEQVLGIVAAAESRSPEMGCHRSHISVPNVDVTALLADLLERGVLLHGQKEYYLLNVKLYLLWAQKNLHGSE